MKLTEPQRRALQALAKHTNMMPAEIGYAITADRSHPLKPQGAGRLGGTMAARLEKLGLVKPYRDRWATDPRWTYRGYQITDAGRAKLREGETR